MIIPNTIPNWYKIIQESEKHDLKINLNVDPFSGVQSGHLTFQDKSYPFRLEVHKYNMILSMKTFNKEVFDAWAKTIDAPYRILYETMTDFPFHAEWYYECPEGAIIEELIKMVNSKNIRVLDLNQLNLY